MNDLPALLVKHGALSRDTLARALAAASDGDMPSAALRLGLAEEGALARALADYFGCPAVDFSKSVVPVANLTVVAPGYCRQRRVLPVSVGKAEMVLAMADPEDHVLADELRFVTNRKVLRYAAVPAAMERVLDALLREKARGGLAVRGAAAPALPDPTAAWVGVVHGTRKREERTSAIELPELLPGDTLELIAIGEQQQVVEGLLEPIEETPFSAPTPARRERPAAHAPPPPPPLTGSTTVRLQGVGAGRLALVADPTTETREELVSLLGKLGCTVLQAANGRAALDIVREARPDLVALEAMMPMMAGFEVCRAVKGDPLLRPTRVVLTSGVHRGTVAADAKVAFGADAFLEKPYRPEEVLRSAKLLLIGAVDEAGDPAARAAAAHSWKQGAALVRAGRLEEAVALLRQAVARDDLSAEAHFFLGAALSKMGLLFEATAELARSAELRPDVDAAHVMLAQTYEALGFQSSAREAWARAMETCPDEKRKRAMQARLMKLLGL
ncbi:MAG: response regulator [Anaeromyxobacteraceae bacterium]